MLILEAVVDVNTYFWYIFWGEPGSLNDINILDKSSIVGAILTGKLDLKVVPTYVVNGTKRDWAYFLVDRMYPPCAILVATINNGISDKDWYFCGKQEGSRKDVLKRGFGVLVQQFEYIDRPTRLWYLEDIKNVVYTCVIIHNMVVEARRPTCSAEVCGYDDEDNDDSENDDNMGDTQNGDNGTSTNGNATNQTPPLVSLFGVVNEGGGLATNIATSLASRSCGHDV
jgi:hypothetical protein